jgi:hypothetical protein
LLNGAENKIKERKKREILIHNLPLDVTLTHYQITVVQNMCFAKEVSFSK